MAKALAIQHTDIGIIEELIITTNDMNTLGTETLGEMVVQGEKLGKIDQGLNDIEVNLKEAGNQVNWFIGRELRTLSRRMVKDKICMGFILLAVLVLLAIVFYAIFFDKGGNTSLPDALKQTTNSNSWFQDLFDTAASTS